MSAQPLHLGVDIGGTNIKFGVVEETGKVLLQKKIETAAQSGSSAIIDSIVREIESLLRDPLVRERTLESMGFGVPGTADSVNGIVVYAPNLFWRNVELAAAVQPIFHTPVFVAQDTRAAAWAEYLVGEGRGLRGLAAVTLGTGIGCGLVLDGRIFHGAMNTAGEFGHQIVAVEGEACNCGRRGCLEAHAGGLAIVREGKKRIAGLLDSPNVTVADVFRLAEQGNPQARELTDSVVRFIGIGLVNLVNLTSVEMICLSGGISNAPRHLLLDPLVEFVRNRAYEAVSDKVRICRSTLGEDAPMIGAALLCRGIAGPAKLQGSPSH
jgi:glucokinase